MADLRRRTLMRGAALAALAGASGCTSVARTMGFGDVVRVAVSWSATELAAFRSVLAGRGVDDYELIPLGDDIDAALGAGTTGRPNVVALPQPGQVAGNLANLAELPGDIPWHEEYNRIFSRSERFALPFKLAHKSVVWYRKPLFDEHGLKPPNTWAEWLALNDSIIGNRELRTRGVAPLALGGADGWMLDGFFENILLRNFPSIYDALIAQDHDPNLWASDEIHKVLQMLGTMWGRPGVLPGGPRRALVQQFPDAVLEVFRYDRAAMVVAPDFAESVIRWLGVGEDEYDTFTFPALSGNNSPLVVAGDLLVMTKPASQQARDLIRYLSTPDAPLPWIRDTGGFIAANPDTDLKHYSLTLRKLACELRDHEIQFDLSDQLGAAGGRAGLQSVLQEFLQSLGKGTLLDDAVSTASRRMVAVEAG